MTNNSILQTNLKKTQKNMLTQNKYTVRLEKLIELIFFLSAFVAVLSVVVITTFIFIKGMPAILEIGIVNFLLGTEWNPSGDIYGIFPMIISTLFSTIGAIIIGVPIGILTSVFIAEIAPKGISNIVRPAVQLLAGIPSVVYGFFGLIVVVPIVGEFQEILTGENMGGNSLLATSIILGVMILPTIINISETSLRSVPKKYSEGSLALGATKIQTIFKVIIPAAKSGILASVVLGLGRAIGETMAVILVSGNTTSIPNSVFDSLRPLTANIALEMGYATGLHQGALFGTGVVLFVFIMLLNLILTKFVNKAGA